MDSRYTASIALPVSVEEAFAYHQRPGALQRLIPPWESVRIEHSDGSLEPGSRVILKNRVFGIWLRWVAEHTQYEPPHFFADTQVSGPFARWDHHHRFDGVDDHCTLTDVIDYRLPAGVLGRWLGGGKALATIEAMFSYRHRLTRDDLTLGAKHELAPQRIAISGRTGLMGASLDAMLTLLGHQTQPIVRHQAKSDDEIAIWDHQDEAAKLEGVDAVVHLAGKSVADGRWTKTAKQQIRDSRVDKTRALCERLASLDDPPSVLICASAIGVYGDRGDEELTEQSSLADDFLADVGKQWEAACQPAVDAGIRVVHTRFGIVLSPNGGALQKSLLPAKWFGGKLGNGRQWWSWIALEDAVGALYHAIATPSLSGPVNLVAPKPVRNAEFASTLGRVLSRPAIFPAPAFVLRAAMGEMADALLLSSTRASPTRLLDSGYAFRFSDLESALSDCLGKKRLASM